MGVCISRPKKNGSLKEKLNTSFKTRFNGMPPDAPAASEMQARRSFGILKRNTLAKIMRDEYADRVIQHAGTEDETWFDADGHLQSESDDEYRSVSGDFISAGNSLSLPRDSFETPKPSFSSIRGRWLNNQSMEAMKLEIPSDAAATHDGIITEVKHTASFSPHNHINTQTLKEKLDMSTPEPGNTGITSIQMNGEESHGVKPTFDGCLPCLHASNIFQEKRNSQQHTPRRKAMRLFSFKRRSSFESNDGVGSHSFASRGFIEWPMAGSQIPYSAECLEGCWSSVKPSTFKLRAQHYLRNKKKEHAPYNPLFNPVGADIYLSSKKIDHIARFIDLSAVLPSELPNEKENIPSLLIFNVQFPIYPAAMFLGNSDGEGFSLVLYFRLSENYRNDTPMHMKDMLMRFFDNHMEKVKGLVGESVMPFRDRLKFMVRLANPEDIHLSGAEKKLVLNYNEKPVLSRPQHLFHKGTNYFEIDIDVHRFGFIARKAVESFRDRLKSCVLDIGFTIQGNKPEELPEHMLSCICLNRLDITKYTLLSTTIDEMQ